MEVCDKQAGDSDAGGTVCSDFGPSLDKAGASLLSLDRVGSAEISPSLSPSAAMETTLRPLPLHRDNLKLRVLRVKGRFYELK